MATKGTAQDRWKRKDWYTVLAPDYFHNVEVGKILSTEAKTLPGKSIDTTVYDMTNDPKKAHMKMLLEITHLEGKKAHTKIRDLELVRAFVRSLVRRRITKIESVVSVETRDAIKVRIKALTITAAKCRSSQKGKIRRAMMKATFELGKAKTFEELLMDTIGEKLQKVIREEINLIYPVRNVEIRRIQVINPPISVGRPKPKKEEASSEKRLSPQEEEEGIQADQYPSDAEKEAEVEEGEEKPEE